MTREESIAILDGFKHNPLFSSTHAQAFDMAISALKGEWIPVSERLPENNDDVLVYDYSDIFVAWYSGINGNWCSADNRFDEYTPILAWMPLPEPYQKGGE